jgi:hypothetical protein
VEKVLRCDCGFVARADDEGELVARVRQHAREAHGMESPPSRALVLPFRGELNEDSNHTKEER